MRVLLFVLDEEIMFKATLCREFNHFRQHARTHLGLFDCVTQHSGDMFKHTHAGTHSMVL